MPPEFWTMDGSYMIVAEIQGLLCALQPVTFDDYKALVKKQMSNGGMLDVRYVQVFVTLLVVFVCCRLHHFCRSSAFCILHYRFANYGIASAFFRISFAAFFVLSSPSPVSVKFCCSANNKT